MVSERVARLREIELQQLLKPAAAVAVLLAAAYYGPRASMSQLILFVGAGAGLILLQVPELGLLAMPISALVVPFSIGTGTDTSLNLPILLVPALLGVWVANMYRRRAMRLVPSRINLPVLFFAISAGLSFLAGNVPWDYFASTASLRSQLGGLAIFVFSAALLLIVGNLIRDSRWLEWITWSFLALGGVYIISRVVPGLGWLTARYSDGSTGSLFWVWLVALAAGQSLFNKSLRTAMRVGLAALVVATLYLGFAYRSWESGWIPAVAALLVLLWLYSWRVGALATAAGAFGVFVLRPGLISSILSVESYSLSTRFMAWQIVLGDILPLNPILGLGPANYHFYTPLFTIAGYYVEFNSHNQYVDILAQTGIVGLVMFVWLVAAIALLGWKLRRVARTGFERAYVNACLAGLAGSLVAGMLGDWFLPFVYNIGIAGFRASVLGWLFLGGLVVVENMAGRSPSTRCNGVGS